MSAPTIADLSRDAEREFRAAFGDELVVKSCQTFAESHYRGGFRLVLANTTGSCEVLYSDLELEISFNAGRYLEPRSTWDLRATCSLANISESIFRASLQAQR
jgi:hypothetical protein